MSDIVIFEAEAQQVEVRLEGETLWITQAQMAELFDVQKAAVSKHLKNIYASGELEQEATVSKMETVRKEGRRTVTRQIEHYNLDAIISVGYRVNSRQATHFRQWATRVLRVYLTQGYSLNEHRLARQGLEELEQAVDLLAKTLTRQELVTDIGREVVGLILSYSKTWRLLQNYDEGKLTVPAGAQPARGVLGLDEARRAMPWPVSYASVARPVSCLPAIGVMVWRLFWVISSRRCLAMLFTRPARSALPICSILSSRTIRFRTATNAPEPFCSCCICARRVCA